MSPWLTKTEVCLRALRRASPLSLPMEEAREETPVPRRVPEPPTRSSPFALRFASAAATSSSSSLFLSCLASCHA